MTMPFVGGDGWDSAKLLEIGGQAMNNTFFSSGYAADNPDPTVQSFVQTYKSIYNGETPDLLAALGYDAGRILFDAITRAGTTEGPKLRDALAATVGFKGITGIITIDADRNARKPAVIIGVNNGKLAFKETILPD